MFCLYSKDIAKPMIDIGLAMSLGRQLKEMQNKTNFENRCLVFLLFKKEQDNDGVGDISSLFQRHCQTNVNHSFSCSFLNIRNTRCLFLECFILCRILVL